MNRTFPITISLLGRSICTDFSFIPIPYTVRLPCFDNPCENGGICVDEGDTFVCKCSTGYHGERCHCKSFVSVGFCSDITL